MNSIVKHEWMTRNDIKSLRTAFNTDIINFGKSNIVVMYSGGHDSTCLLGFAKQQLIDNKSFFGEEVKLHAIHINHGLYEINNEFERHCEKNVSIMNKNYSERYINYHCLKLNLEVKSGDSIEYVASKARYKAIEDYCKENFSDDYIVLTAHHLDDNVESYLIGLSRSNPDSYKGMPIYDQERKLYRPFLNITKGQLGFLVKDLNVLQWGTTHVEDPSNEDTKFYRNKLRKQLIPILNENYKELVAGIKKQIFEERYRRVKNSIVLKGTPNVSFEELACYLAFVTYNKVKEEYEKNLNFLWIVNAYHVIKPALRRRYNSWANFVFNIDTPFDVSLVILVDYNYKVYIHDWNRKKPKSMTLSKQT